MHDSVPVREPAFHYRPDDSFQAHSNGKLAEPHPNVHDHFCEVRTVFTTLSLKLVTRKVIAWRCRGDVTA